MGFFVRPEDGVDPLLISLTLGLEPGEQVRVEVDRYKLEAHGLTLSTLESRLRAANVDINAGTLEDGGKDCFVHHSAIQSDGFRSLQEGAEVEFDIVEGTKGPAAENVVQLS